MTNGDESLERRTVRALVEGHDASSLQSALIEEGWVELAAQDAELACTALFEELGARASISSALDLVAMSPLGTLRHDFGIVAWPTLHDGVGPTSNLSDGTVEVRGICLPGWREADHLVVPTLDQSRSVFVRIRADAVGIEAVGGMAPDAGLGTAVGVAPVLEVLERSGPWAEAIRVPQLCIGHSLVGAADRILDVAREHAQDRHQFDQPIAAFQAVKHSLAEVHVAVTAARRALHVGWCTEDPLTTLAAKALAGRSVAVAMTNGMQVCGATSFTKEHAIHQVGRTAQLMDCLLGPSDWLCSEIGRVLLDTRSVPRLPKVDGIAPETPDVSEPMATEKGLPMST